MKYSFTPLRSLLFWGALLCLGSFAQAQTITATRCYSGPPVVINGQPFGQSVGALDFTPNFPAGYEVVEVQVSIEWSAYNNTVGSCAAPGAGAVDLSEIGFYLTDPSGNIRVFAASAGIGTALTPPALSTWSGSTTASGVTTTFAFSGLNSQPSGAPINGTTYQANGDNLQGFIGVDPTGAAGWVLSGIDDVLNNTELCVRSFCVTVTACQGNLNAVCRTGPVDVFLTNAGTRSLVLGDVLNFAASDTSCFLQSVTYSNNNFTCANVGSTLPVTVTLTDRLGNVSACNTTVRVRDTIGSVINCRNYTVHLNNAGTFTMNANDSLQAVDNCGVTTRRFNGSPSVTYDCSNIGLNNLTLSASDAHLNNRTCVVQIQVIDTFPPTPVCRDTVVYLNATGTISVDASMIDGGSFEVCPPVTTRLINGVASYTYVCADVGVRTATLTVSDFYGNDSSCTANVTVLDTIRPTTLCQGRTLYLDNFGLVGVTAAQINNGSTDNCTPAGLLTLAINGQPSLTFDCTNLGSQNITFTARDANGNVGTCTAPITVLDTVRPVANCQAYTAVLDASGSVLVSAANVNAGSSDLCSSVSLLINGQPSVSFGCAQLFNPQVVTLRATDASGNFNECTANVTVVDTTAPVARCRQNLPVYLTPAGIVTVAATAIDSLSSDNCGIDTRTINGTTSFTYTCAQAGSVQNATLRVTDASNNFRECIATVVVRDTVRPAAICQNITVNLGAAGNVTVNAVAINNGSTDNCGTGGLSFLINGQPSVVYTCTNLGNNNAVLTVRDASNNVQTCNAVVRVEDNTPPTAICSGITAFVNVAGVVTVTPAQIQNPLSADNCGITGATINGVASVTYTCDSLQPLVGVRTARLGLRDASNNQAFCNASVTVRDTIRPTAICNNYTAVLNGAGLAVVRPSNIRNSSSADNCGITIARINGLDSLTFNCANLGINPVTLELLDASGNTGSCVADVTVVDDSLPTAVCQNITVYLGATGQVTVLPSDIDGGSGDNCANPTLTINNQPSFVYTCNDIGINNAVLTVSDASSNSTFCVADVTVLDTTRPVARCRNNLNVFINAGGTISVSPAQIDSLSSDNCFINSSNLNGAPSRVFNCTNLGNNTVRLNVLDNSGNTSFCDATVVVRDTTRPTITCNNRTVFLNNAGTITITPSSPAVVATATDNCGAPTLSFTGFGATRTFTCADVATPPVVTVRATDASGNFRECSATITVRDTVRPNAVCQNPTLTLNASGFAVLTTTDVNAGSADACGLASLSVSRDTFRCADVGNQSVTLTVRDNNNNQNTCTATVTVLENIAPVAQCSTSLLRYLDASGTFTLSVAQVDSLSSDNCGITSRLINNASSLTFDCTDIGNNNITLLVEDASGNQNTCNTNLAILDTLRPSLTCQNINAHLSATGSVTISPAAPLVVATADNCGTPTLTFPGFGATRSFNCAQRGANTVTVRSTDASGNFLECTATVTVLDTTLPVAQCNNTTLRLNNAGVAVLTTAQVNAGSSDNCGAVLLSLSRDTFRCADIAAVQSVTLTVRDSSNNVSTCTAQITVLDTVRPVAQCRSNFDLPLNGTTASLAVAQIDSLSSDACGISSRLINGSASLNFTCANLGANVIRLVVVDNNGNRDSCSTTVTVRDTTRPVITCTNRTVQLSAVGQVTVTASTLATATDNCTASPTVSIQGSGASINFTCTNRGNNSLVLQAQDAQGNINTCTAVVTVQDVTPPTANCQNISVSLDSTGRVTVPALAINNGSNDACGIASFTASPAVLTCANIGINSVVLTVTDSAGLSSTCTAQVTVQDTARPTVRCRNITVFVSALAPSSVTVTPLMIDNGSFDSCGIASRTINGASNVLYTCANLGANNAVLRITDNSGNTDSCVAVVTVQDTVRPTAICRNTVIAFVGTNGNAVLTPARLDSASTDNCSLNPAAFLINGQPTATYTCANIGSNLTATLTVVDGSGRSNTCVSNIQVRDTVRPVANCFPGPINATLSSTSPATVVVNATALGNGTDNCVTVNYTINGAASFTYTCANLGNNNATFRVTDAYGNVDSCVAVVNVRDLTAPIAGCRNLIVQLDANGQVRVPAISLNNGSTDNCGIVSYQIGGQDTVSFNCTNIGPNAVVLVVRDAAGLTASCNSIVTVQDNVPPVARCFVNPVPAFVNASGVVIVPAAALDSAGTDNCGIVSRTFSNGAPTRQYTCANIGLNPAVITITDATGLSATCSGFINVRDTFPPVANCQNITVSLNSAGQAVVNAIALNSTTNPSADNCGISTYLINNQATFTYNCNNVGPNNATLTVRDQYNNQNTCTAVVTVVDNTPPTIVCNNRTFFVNAAGTVTVTPTQVATGLDTCSIVSWTINGQASQTFTCANLSTPVVVTIEARDPSGNPSTCQATLTIQDTIRPTAQCRNLNLALDNNGEIIVNATQINDNSFDNCAIATFLINNQPSQRYTCANVGNNNAVLTVRDSSGLQSTCVAVITIRDSIAPTIVCPTTVSVPLGANGQAVVQATSLNNGTAADACGPLVFRLNGQTSQTYNCTNVGSNPATFTVADANGNLTTCPVVINVLDTLAPIARCQDLTVFLNNGGFVQVNATDINAPAPNASSDNCGIFSYRINGSNFVLYDCSSVTSNPNLAVLTIQDIYGNVDTCQSRITVRDTIGPDVVCQNLVINLSSAGPRTLTPADLDPGNATADACGIDTMYVVPSLITCNDVGNIPVTLYALDVNGNLDSCTAIATVILDGPSPTATTPLCEGDNLNLFTNPPATGLTYTYNWSGPNNFSAAVQNPVINGVTGAATGLYAVTITPTNGTGCPVSDTVSVYVNVVPEPILAANTSLCEGGNGFIFLQNASSYTGTNFSYQWALGGGAISNNSDTLFLSGLSQANAGNYTLTITVDGCSDNNSATPFNLVINTLPPAPQPTVNNPCAGEDLNFLANPQDTANRTYTFAWSGPASFNSSLENPSLAAVNQTNAGLYSLTVTDNNTCTATATVTASIRPVPAVPTLQYNAPLCLGDVLELTDGTSHTGSPLNFVWTLPDLTSTTTTTPQLLLNNAQAGLYRLQVSLNGCFSVVDTETVNYQPLPLANDDALTVPFRDSLLAVTVIANDVLPVNGYTISIIQAPTHGSLVNNANGTFDYRPNYSHFGLDTFRYAICDVLCGNSCDTATVFINVTTDFECFIPNAISPNGDGINDVLNIRCVNSYPNAEVQIFTRWGTRVYSGPMAGFNGQFNGNDLPDGTYFYVLKLNDQSRVSNDQYSGYLIIQR